MPLAIYTSIIGCGYELPSLPMGDRTTYICFTDQSNLESKGWRVVRITPILQDDPVRSSRDPKIRPHYWLANYKSSIYIDPSVSLKVSGPELWKKLMPAGLKFLAA